MYRLEIHNIMKYEFLRETTDHRPHQTLIAYLALVLLCSRQYQIGSLNFEQVTLTSRMSHVVTQNQRSLLSLTHLRVPMNY